MKSFYINGTHVFLGDADGQILSSALNVLRAGKGWNLASGDHASANETCARVIARVGTFSPSVADDKINTVINDAVIALQHGVGCHKKQSDHSGGNRCIDVISGASF